MQTVTLGATGLEVTRLAYGTWQFGGDWGPVDEQSAVVAISQARSFGINFFDTAQAYGFGRAERLLGRALADDLRNARESVVIATKGGLRMDAADLVRDASPAWLRKGTEASLDALGTDYIDLYQVHWPDPIEQVEEGWSTFAELKAEGLVRHIGVSNFDVEQLRRAQSIAPVETLQPQYSLLDREIEDEVLPFAQREGIGVIVYSPMASGLLSGGMTRERIGALPQDDWRRRSERFREPELTRDLDLVERLRRVGARHDATPGAVAVAWVLRNPAVDGAITGFRRPDQVEPIIAAANLDLDEADVATIEGDD
jgi:aryl-alcohol dehydrogenase-like predicted oxidoreductase